jgi:hypothetical protein
MKEMDSMSKEQGKPETVIADVYCWHHKNLNLATAMAKLGHVALEAQLAEAKDKQQDKEGAKVEGRGDDDFEDWQDGNIINGLIYDLWKMFGHAKKDAYMFGKGVIEFPTWLNQHHPSQYRKLVKVMGSRFDVYFENCAVIYFLAPYYREYLAFLQTAVKGGLNNLGKKLRKKLATVEVLAAVRTRSMWFTYVLQPLRVLTAMRSFHAMAPVAEELYTLLTQDTGTLAKRLLAGDLMPFDMTKDELALVEAYRLHHAEEIQATIEDPAYDKINLATERNLEGLIDAQIKGALVVFDKFYGDQLPARKYPGGKGLAAGRYSQTVLKDNPDLLQALDETPSTNDPSERIFASYDYALQTLSPNTSHFMISALAAARFNNVPNWLMSLEAVLREALTDWAFSEAGKAYETDRTRLKAHAATMARRRQEQADNTLRLEFDRYKDWFKLHLQLGDLKKSVGDLKAAVKKAGTSKTAQLAVLKQQQKLWRQAGVPKADLPIFSLMDMEKGKRRNKLVGELLPQLLGVCVAFGKKKLTERANPLDEAKEFVANLSAFKGGTLVEAARETAARSVDKVEAAKDQLEEQARRERAEEMAKKAKAGKKRKARGKQRGGGKRAKKDDTMEEDEESSSSSSESSDSESESESSESSDDDEEVEELGEAVAPAGFDAVAECPKHGGLTIKSLAGQVVFYKYEPARGPRGWFWGTVTKEKLTKAEQKSGFTANVRYTRAGTSTGTASGFSGTVATMLAQKDYGLRWMLLEKRVAKVSGSRKAARRGQSN